VTAVVAFCGCGVATMSAVIDAATARCVQLLVSLIEERWCRQPSEDEG